MPNKRQICTAINNVLDKLVEKDSYLLEQDVNERSISHRLAIYLEEEIAKWKENWQVDCEYNRDVCSGSDLYTKKLNLAAIEDCKVDIDDEHAKTVYPDIIVHRRGKKCNLLVIEVKKNSSSKEERDYDKKNKLPAYLEQFDYDHAIFVLVYIKDQLKCCYEWIDKKAGSISKRKCIEHGHPS